MKLKVIDTMITCGPIDDTALRSSAIQLTEPSSASDGDILYLVRILFTDQGRLEDLLYPIEQCDSWFVRYPTSNTCRFVLSREGPAQQTATNLRNP